MTGAAHDHVDVDVAIVGLGPCGLILAQLLAHEGVRVAAIDRSRLPLGYPRATHLDDETMRSFQTAGVAHLEPTFSLVGDYIWYDAQWRQLLKMPIDRRRPLGEILPTVDLAGPQMLFQFL